MRFLGVDPGPDNSAWACYDVVNHAIVGSGWKPNLDMVDFLVEQGQAEDGPDILVIEKIVSYGRPVGNPVFATCRWSGRFEQAFGKRTELISQPEVRIHFCGTAQAKYTNIKHVLYDRFGGDRKVCFGTKKKPGPMYGMKGDDVFAALAVALMFADLMKTPANALGGVHK